MQSDENNKDPANLTGFCAHNQTTINFARVRSSHPWLQFRQKYMTDSKTTLGTSVLESSTVVDKMAIHEEENKMYYINVTDLDLLKTMVLCGVKFNSGIDYSHYSHVIRPRDDRSSARLFNYTFILQLIVASFVMSLVVFCFLHFKPVRSAIDVELQELVIKDHNAQIDHNIDCEKEKSKTMITSSTITETDKQLQAKLPDIINSRP